MFHSLQIDSGKKRVHQSTKIKLKLQSLQRFAQFANNKDILDLARADISVEIHNTPSATNRVNMNEKKQDSAGKVQDSYKAGLLKIGNEIRSKDHDLSRLRLHFPKPAPDVDEENADIEEGNNLGKEL
jgi:hypothetical protein